MKAKVTWVLIADGAQARVMVNDGPGKGLQPVPELKFSQEPLQAQEIMSDRPGRAMKGGGASARSAMEYHSDPVQVREARFVKHVADVLEKHRLEGAFDRLIIAAAPTALGDIRGAMSDGMKQAILAELPKDLTNIPRPQLDAHFEDILAV